MTERQAERPTRRKTISTRHEVAEDLIDSVIEGLHLIQPRRDELNHDAAIHTIEDDNVRHEIDDGLTNQYAIAHELHQLIAPLPAEVDAKVDPE